MGIYAASTPPFSNVWQIAGEMVSAFKTPHTSLPRDPFGGVRLKLRREAAGDRAWLLKKHHCVTEVTERMTGL
jgi:hypothetical protein